MRLQDGEHGREEPEAKPIDVSQPYHMHEGETNYIGVYLRVTNTMPDVNITIGTSILSMIHVYARRCLLLWGVHHSGVSTIVGCPP